MAPGPVYVLTQYNTSVLTDSISGTVAERRKQLEFPSKPPSKNTTCLDEDAPDVVGTSQFPPDNLLGQSDLSELLADEARFVDLLRRYNNSKVDNFEAALKDFNVTAEDVQNYVAASCPGEHVTTSSRCGIAQSNGETVEGVEEEDDSSSADSSSEDSDTGKDTLSDSESEYELDVRDGLETITEEERGAISGAQSAEGTQ